MASGSKMEPPQIIGLCECAGGKRPYNGLHSIRAALAELADGKVHLASYVKIVGVSRHACEQLHFIPLAFELSCNTFSAADEEACV